MADFQLTVKETHADGLLDLSQDDFDCRQLQIRREATRDLIEAEEVYETAKRHVETLGLDITDEDSCNGDMYEQSLAETQLERLAREFDWSRIEAWRAQVSTPETEDDVKSIRVDDWDSRSVGVSDSFSIMAHDEHRKRIDQWRNSGDLLRQQNGWGAEASSKLMGKSY